MPVQQWNAAQTDASITISGSGLIATKASASGTRARAFALNGVSTGKYYWEITLRTVSQSLNCTVGVGNTSSAVNTVVVGGDTSTIGWWFASSNAGEVDNNNALIATWATLSAGTNILCFAMDLTSATKVIWGRLENGSWSGSGLNTGNPVAGTLGLTVPAGVLAAPVVPAVGFSATTTPDGATGKFASASWTYTAPSGFLSFDAMAWPPPVVSF